MQNFSINEIIELAVQIEQSGYNFYDNALKKKDLNEKAVKLLEKLRDEEVNHERIFKNLRTDEDFLSMGDQVDWQAAADYLKAISDSHVFSKPEAAIKLATESKNEKEILVNAVQFEKDTLLFFHSIYQKANNEKSKKIINAIIEEEVSHVMILKDRLHSL